MRALALLLVTGGVALADLSWLELLPGSQLVIAAGDLARCETRSLDR